MKELYSLHGEAGWPSMRQLSHGEGFSHAVVHDLFTKATLPRFPLLMTVVGKMCELAPDIDNTATKEKFRRLWRAAEAADTTINDTSVERKSAPSEEQLAASVVASTTKNRIRLTFIHPADRNATLTAAVSIMADGSYILDQLIAAQFLASESDGMYILREQRTGRLIGDGETLQKAGIAEDSTFYIDHTVSNDLD